MSERAPILTVSAASCRFDVSAPALSRLISREPLYHALSRLCMADALRLRRQHAAESDAAARG